MTNIGDIYKSRHDQPWLVVDVEVTVGNTYMFHLKNLYTGDYNKWFEPFDQQLNAGYWTYLG